MAGERARRQLERYRQLGQTEQAVYRPARSGLAAREITVLVDREGAEPFMHAEAPGFRVTALNDERHGIPSDPRISDAGKDQIDLAERMGGTRTTRPLERFLAQDPDWVTVKVQ
jgi:hypothetical protein